MKSFLPKMAFLGLTWLCVAQPIPQTCCADIIFSVSSTDPNAGSSLSLKQGENQSIFVWVSTETGQTINGLGLDFVSSDFNVIEATDHLIENPVIFGSLKRWTATSPGTLSDAVDDSNAFAILDIGLSTGGTNDFVLHSEIQFEGTQQGSTVFSVEEGIHKVTDTANIGSIFHTISTGTADITVTSVPEASALVALSALSGFFVFFGTKRRRKKRTRTQG